MKQSTEKIKNSNLKETSYLLYYFYTVFKTVTVQKLFRSCKLSLVPSWRVTASSFVANIYFS